MMIFLNFVQVQGQQNLQNTTVNINLYRMILNNRQPSQVFGSLGSKGWHSGENARLPLMWSWLKSRRRYIVCGLSLLLVFSFALGGFYPGIPVFPSPQKSIFPDSNSTRNQVDEEPLCGCAMSKSLFTYFLFKI